GRLGHVEVFLQMCSFVTSIFERPRLFLCLQHARIRKLIYTQNSEEPLMVGIGRAALRDGVEHLRERTRIFNTSSGDIPRSDSQMLGIIGQLSAQLAAAEELVRAIGREFDAGNLRQATLTA